MSKLIAKDKEPNAILKTFGIPLIIISAVLIVITGLDIDRLTPVIGLLGTIAGYLLGKADSEVEKPENDPFEQEKEEDFE